MAGLVLPLLLAGSTVAIEGDDALPERDPAGRLRLYVWLPGGGLLNAELVRQGLGRAAVPDGGARLWAVLRDAERDARGEAWGVWSTLTCYDNPGARLSSG